MVSRIYSSGFGQGGLPWSGQEKVGLLSSQQTVVGERRVGEKIRSSKAHPPMAQTDSPPSPLTLCLLIMPLNYDHIDGVIKEVRVPMMQSLSTSPSKGACCSCASKDTISLATTFFFFLTVNTLLFWPNYSFSNFPALLLAPNFYY